MNVAIIGSGHEQSIMEAIKMAAASIQSITVPMGQAGITFSYAAMSMNIFKNSCQSSLRLDSVLTKKKESRVFFDKPKSKYHR